jgi:hypothetical protein
MDLRVFDDVIILEHEDKILLDTNDVVDQPREDLLDDRRLHGIQRRAQTLADTAVNCLEGGIHIAPEMQRIIIAFVEGEPGKGESACPGPVTDEGRLAEPCRGGDERTRNPHLPRVGEFI